MNGEFGVTGPVFEDEDFVNFGGFYPDIVGVAVSATFNADSTCDNIACHGGTGGVDWYATSVGCEACHQPGGNSSIDPLFTSGAGLNGKHDRHYTDKSIGCEVCHEEVLCLLTLLSFPGRGFAK